MPTATQNSYEDAKVVYDPAKETLLGYATPIAHTQVANSEGPKIKAADRQDPVSACFHEIARL